MIQGNIVSIFYKWWSEPVEVPGPKCLLDSERTTTADYEIRRRVSNHEYLLLGCSLPISYRPFHTGARFSAKAKTPSLASSLSRISFRLS